jgi:hypothetical protein
MYEWIGEAIVKGITDVQEFQLYARQIEIHLYGAASPCKKLLWDEILFIRRSIT